MKFAGTLLILLTSLPQVTTCTPSELRSHLERLKVVVAWCAQEQSVGACNSAAVGLDDTVVLPSGLRLVKYDWLRSVLDDVASNKKSSPELKVATTRLDRELQELASPAQVAPAEVKRDRSELRSILSHEEILPPQPKSFWARLWDDFLMWLNQKLAKATGTGTHTNWAGLILIGVVGLSACGGLLWWFRRTIRRRYAPSEKAGKISAQHQAAMADWRDWLEDAQRFASEGRWQESIHRVYWAAVAQLESRGSWRHDAARTPREYLGLLATGSAQRSDLARLTRYLEMFWYGGQAAQQKDYEDARELLERLVRA